MSDDEREVSEWRHGIHHFWESSAKIDEGTCIHCKWGKKARTCTVTGWSRSTQFLQNMHTERYE